MGRVCPPRRGTARAPAPLPLPPAATSPVLSARRLPVTPPAGFFGKGGGSFLSSWRVAGTLRRGCNVEMFGGLNWNVGGKATPCKRILVGKKKKRNRREIKLREDKPKKRARGKIHAGYVPGCLCMELKQEKKSASAKENDM